MSMSASEDTGFRPPQALLIGTHERDGGALVPQALQPAPIGPPPSVAWRHSADVLCNTSALTHHNPQSTLGSDPPVC